MSAPRRLRARQIFGLILLGLILLAVVETLVAVAVARVIGPWPTMLAIVIFSFSGLFLVRRGGSRSLQALHRAGVARRVPGGELADPVLLLVGGLLMIPPGFVLDAVGLVFVVPFTRTIARRLLGVALKARVVSRVVSVWPTGPDVIQGDVVHRDEGHLEP